MFQSYVSKLTITCFWAFHGASRILETFFFRLFSWTESIELVKLANIKISFVLAICFEVQRNFSISSQFSQGLPIFQEKRIQSVKGSLSQIQEGTVNMYSLVVRCIFNAPQKPFMGMAQKLSPNRGTANGKI